MVELGDGGKGRIRLERYAIEPLPKDAVVDGNIMNLEAVGDSLRRGWKRMGSRIKNLAMALPSAQVITKKITVPAGLREDELETQVETEANQYIPFALEEVNLDFQMLGPAPNSPEDVEVLIAASRKEKVEDRVAVAEVGGLKAMVMDIDSFAAQTAFELMETQLPDGGRDQVIALVDVGASHDEHQRAAQQSVGLHARAAVRRQPAHAGDPAALQPVSGRGRSGQAQRRSAGYVRRWKCCSRSWKRLALEVTRALQFFFTSTQFNQVNHIFLSGGCATIPGLDAGRRASALKSTRWSRIHLRACSVSPKIKQRQLTQDAPALVVATGLAMRRFDA